MARHQPTESKMARFQITIEYDIAEGMEEGETYEQAAAREEQDWRAGGVDVQDILSLARDDAGFQVHFAVIP